MNVNIILDSDYICNKLNEGKEEKINALFTFMKNMSNIIIIQDNDQNIVRNIIKNEKIKEQEIKQTEIFLSALIQGTNKYDFVTNIKYENNFIEFVKNLKEKNYPIQIIISDKKIDEKTKSYLIENTEEIIKIIKKYSEKHMVTENEEYLKDNKDINVLNFDEYSEILLNTFWCSSKITIVGREFFEGINSSYKKINSNNYKNGLKYLINIFSKISQFTGQKVEIEIITGVKEKMMSEWKMNSRNLTDNVYSLLLNSNKDITFRLKIIRWDTGDEIKSGEGHGRRIYSEFGGLDTGFMPFDLFTNDMKYKDTSFHWIAEKEYLKPLQIGNILAERPV